MKEKSKNNLLDTTIIIFLSILVLITVILGINVYRFNKNKKVIDNLPNQENILNETNNNQDSSCNQITTNLSDIKINTECKVFNFSVNNNDQKLLGKLTSYDDNGHYTLILTINGKESTTDFFTNKNKLAIWTNIEFSNYKNYIIIKSDAGAQGDGQYIAIFDQKTGKKIFTFEDGTINIKDNIITITKGNGVIFCDSNNKSVITGKTYVYKMDTDRITLVSEKDNTCADNN